jgi:L-2,4-diaminobutyric acid acetyltransferase
MEEICYIEVHGRLESPVPGARLTISSTFTAFWPISTDDVLERSGNIPDHRIDSSEAVVRPPRAEDAAGVSALVGASGSLDANSPYAYLLLCTDFAGSGAVAEADGEIVGFVLGYRPPERPEAVFVWQVAVREDQRGRGLARALLDDVLARTMPDGVTHLEATVTPSNGASWALFRGFAKRVGAPCREVAAFSSHLFPDGDHEEEVRIRIGPLNPEALPAQRS